ncbi:MULTISPECIES: DJ-1 family glyoxalase III [Ruminococcus]|uniref:DJ-1 family protein n=1 Tax=Ruminococcus albus (strain ATCC 27210 / DSM 20455 / JCM 14654 / NCDO 2250 / 7) TaxID=697329 RepID=E6UAM7_RUMA7|nr:MULTISPECIES: DJ-1 family glyoxalase III [Ruminococcus]ADU22449.1 DJ-1 family protein [Ruminococcus albus 7 = DSM 20455]MCR5022561.1 DJ-1/PfpI family protein [Ruminococcus sp.]
MVYVFLAHGFEEIEALAPIDILRRAGVELVTVGVEDEYITAAHKVTFAADITVDKVVLDENVDMIVLPGGMPGTINLENNDYVQAAIDYCVKNDKYIASICAAPSILGHKGLLKGKKAICFPGFEKDLEGAVISEKSVEVDGKFITAKGAGVAVDFALTLVSELVSAAKAENIRKGIQCQN